MLIPDELETPPPRTLKAAMAVADSSAAAVWMAALATVAIPAAVFGRMFLDDGELELGPAAIAALAASAVALIITLVSAVKLLRDVAVVRFGLLVRGVILAARATPAGGPYNLVSVDVRYTTRDGRTLTGTASAKAVGTADVFKPGKEIALLYLPDRPQVFAAHQLAFPLMHGRAS